MFEIATLFIASAINVLLGITVLLKNAKSATNRLFFCLTTSFVIWSIVNYFSVHPIIIGQLWWIRLVLFFASILCLAVFVTFSVFPRYSMPQPRKLIHTATIATLLIAPLTLTPLVFKGLEYSNGSVQPIPNFGIGLFALLVFSLLTGGILTIVQKYRHAKGKQKEQFRFVIYGLAGTFSLIFVTNFLLVVVLNNSSLVPLGPAYTLIFSCCFAYAIVRHRLFDIRAAVARAVAYLLSLGFIAIVYGGIVFVLLSLLTNNASQTTQRAIYIGLLLLTPLFYQRVKAFFDRVTNKVFFRDAYDPQQFLNRLNNVIVGNIDLQPLLRQCAEAICDTMKVDFCAFLIDQTDSTPRRLIGAGTMNFDQEKIYEALQHLPNSKQKLVITDELSDRQVHLNNTLSEGNIAVVASLSVPSNQRGRIGYLVLGNKRSGNPLSNTDFQVLEIISKEQVIAIQNSLRFEEIEQFNVTLQQKVNAATRELRKTNEKLKELDQTKDDFISMASHQLRTPLTSIKGYVSMVMDGDAGKVSKKQNELLNQAFVSSQRMVYLIADLLNVSRLRTGKFVIEQKETNLAEVITGEISQLTETAKGRNLVLTYEKPKDFPTLMLDETKIRQVIMNFADNAIYYTPSGGHIKVALADLGDTIEFTVTDDGIGVPKAEQHHLFNKFYRAGNAKKARPDGTGLGLFMAKKVVVAQGGSIIFKTQEGKGSTFGFSFAKKPLLPENFKGVVASDKVDTKD